MQFVKYLFITPTVIDFTISAGHVLSDPLSSVSVMMHININIMLRGTFMFYNLTLINVTTFIFFF